MKVNDLRFLMLIIFLSPQAFSHPILIIRHGQGLNNVQKIRNSDVKRSYRYPLTELGNAQSLQIAKELKFSQIQAAAIFHSPLLRTQQTAIIIKKTLTLQDDQIISHPLLAATAGGELEGQYDDQITDKHLKGHETQGEDYGDLSVRLYSFLSELCQKDYIHPVLLVTHGTLSRVLQYLLETFPNLTVDQYQQELLNRFVFTPNIRTLLFDPALSPTKYTNGEARQFDSEPFCKLYRRKF